MKRISTIDFTRGLVMIIMALDHTRDFMHETSLTQSPTDMNNTTPAIFFARWITHFCAPIFVFLSGASAYLLFKKDNNQTKTRNFLLGRGLWLLILEFTLVNFALWFDVRFQILIFEVIAAIGFGFIILSLLLKVPTKVIGIIGLVIIFGHDIWQLLSFSEGSSLKSILSPLFTLNVYPASPKFTFILAYPPIPWLGIMLAGFATGRLFELDAVKRRKLFFQIGLSAIVLFIVIRFVNVYGDTARWSHQKTSTFTFLSFMNVTKYPPSLLFTLMTLGGMFLVLSFSEGFKGRLAGIVTVYGKVPLFYFLVHLYVLHVITIIMVLLQGYSWDDMIFGSNFGRPKPASGLSLSAIYLIWIAVVVALYPLCKWYGNYKANHREKAWLRYL